MFSKTISSSDSPFQANTGVPVVIFGAGLIIGALEGRGGRVCVDEGTFFTLFARGISKRCPTSIVSLVRLLALLIADTEEPYAWLMRQRVSPFCTV